MGISMDPRQMLRFRHADAAHKPKRHRPATVAGEPDGGRYPLFYSSTFKRGREPRDAVVADPRAEPHDDARRLADHLGEVIDERSYFHGSLLSETHSTDPSLEPFGTRFPIDPFEQLQEQGEEGLLAFHAAWQRLSWILPHQRAFVLDSLWWQAELDPHEELAMTLLLYDGWSPAEIADLRGRAAHEPGVLLPRTRSLLAALPELGTGERAFPDRTELLAMLERGWQSLQNLGRRSRPRVHLPDWSRIPGISPTGD